MKPVNLEHYLKKIRLDPHLLSSLTTEEQVSYLYEIYSAHVKTFPYSNFELRTIARQHLIQRQALSFFSDKTLISTENDGYCFQSAALMADALRQLGYKTRFCAARVLIGAPVNAPEILALPPTHLIVIVTIDEKEYLLDPGLGSSAPRYPILITGKDESVIQDCDVFKFYKSEDHQLYVLEKKTSRGWLRLMQTDLKPKSDEEIEFNLLKLERHPDTLSIRDTKTVIGIITDNGRKTLMWDAESGELKFTKNEGTETTHQLITSFEEGHEILKQEFGIHHVSAEALKTHCTKTVTPQPVLPWTIDFPLDESELKRMSANLSL